MDSLNHAFFSIESTIVGYNFILGALDRFYFQNHLSLGFSTSL